MRRSVRPVARRVQQDVECDQMDRLRELIDLVLSSLDEPATGAALAERAHFSRDHLDRLLAAATGESPVGLRRRLLLERAAWQLRRGAAPSDVFAAAGYGSLAAFSRAFARAYGEPPSSFSGELHLPAPNGIHFHPPAGIVVPSGRPADHCGATTAAPSGRPSDCGATTTAPSGRPSDPCGATTTAPSGRPSDPCGATTTAPRDDLTERMVRQHVDRVRELLRLADGVPDLDRVVRPGLVLVWFEGPEETAAVLCERLVFTLEVWVAAMGGEPVPEGGESWLARFERAALGFERLAKRIRDRGAFDDAFVDALCEPPQSFTYGGVLSHILSYGAVRREALASLLTELGADVPCGDPILWEQAQSARIRMARNATTS
jgi:AraC-like DNA-binding protein